MQKKRARERIIMFLCIISLLFTPVLAASQSNAMRVSLDLKSATVKEFFDAVKVQTGLNFIYSTEQVKNMPRITIQSNSQPISEVLNKVLANTGYSYEIEGNIVTIVYQQPKENVRTATGVVVDEGGLPLPGAYIKLSKTEHSTITDNEGKFSINLFHQKEPVLIVSYLGMIVQEVKVAGTKPMTIVMKSDVKSIDEVVVTGYQEIDRRKLASSISSIKGADLIGGEYLSIDKMLQGRLFSYGDAQRYRLGVNAEQIPVNKPRCPFHAYHRDGAMRVDGNYGDTKGYEPNSYGEWQDSPTMKEPPLKVTGEVYNYNEREYDDDYYSQPGDLFRLMPAEEQQLLFENTARAMGDAELFIKQRHVRNCYKADPAYGTGVAKALGIDLQEALKE